MNIITNLMSWPFLVGLVVGYGGRHVYCRLRARWLDRTHPLEGGRRRKQPAVNRTWMGALLAICVVGWSIYQIEVTAHQTNKVIEDSRTFSEQVKQCQKEFNQALTYRAQIQAQNDELAARDRSALRNWLATLLQPPPDIAQLNPSDPVRQAWGIGVTREYMSWAESIEQKRKDNEQERKNHPLPEPTCGK